MCGQLFIQEDLLHTYNIESDKTLFRPNDKLILTQDTSLKHWTAAQWGWNHESSQQLILFARLETVAISRLFSTSYQTKRCVILASGYYEWDQSHIKQQIGDAKAQPLFIAGILDETQHHVAIITHEAQPALAWIHHRQPMVLDAIYAQHYLQTPIKNLDFIRNQDLVVFTKLKQASLFE